MENITTSQTERETKPDEHQYDTVPDIQGRDILTKEDIIHAAIRAAYYKKSEYFRVDL